MTSAVLVGPPEPQPVGDGLVTVRVDPGLLPALARFAKTSGMPTYLRGPSDRTLQVQQQAVTP